MIATLAANGAQGLVVTSDGSYIARRKQLAEQAINHRLPAILPYRQQVQSGGLLGYTAKGLSELAADLVRRQVTVIAAAPNSGAHPLG